MATNDFYTFYPQFNEFLPVYRNIANVWVGNGQSGAIGRLYAMYETGEVIDLGSVTMYPIAVDNGYTGTEAEWAQAVTQLASTSKAAVVSMAYFNSTDGSSRPADNAGWSSAPNPEQGKYIWARITLRWVDSTTSNLYFATYVGKDSPVQSVNAQVGNIVLHGNNMSISDGDNTTIKTYIDNLVFEPETATQADIDALFAAPVSNEPEEPNNPETPSEPNNSGEQDNPNEPSDPGNEPAEP